MRLEIDIPEHQYNNIMAIDSINLGRAPYKGIIMYAINAIKHGKVLEQEPTTKNDLGVDCIDRAELLKAIDTWDKFGCDADTKLVPYQDHYIPYIHYDDVIKCIKGMPSVIPYMPSVTSQPCEDAISRTDAIKAMQNKAKKLKNEDTINGLCGAVAILFDLPSVTPQELIHSKCNQCKYYGGVHDVQGHAPCSYHKIGGVLWNWYCSQFKSEVEE